MEHGSHGSPVANADNHGFCLLSAGIRVACIRVIRVQYGKEQQRLVVKYFFHHKDAKHAKFSTKRKMTARSANDNK